MEWSDKWEQKQKMQSEFPVVNLILQVHIEEAFESH